MSSIAFLCFIRFLYVFELQLHICTHELHFVLRSISYLYVLFSTLYDTYTFYTFDAQILKSESTCILSILCCENMLCHKI